MKKSVLFCAFTCLTITANCQTTWTAGALTRDWNTPGNWSNGLPYGNPDGGGASVTIPDSTTTNMLTPLVSGPAPDSAGSVDIQAGGSLSIADGAELDLWTDPAILENDNSNTISLGGTVFFGARGGAEFIIGNFAFNNFYNDNLGTNLVEEDTISISGVLTINKGTELRGDGNSSQIYLTSSSSGQVATLNRAGVDALGFPNTGYYSANLTVQRYYDASNYPASNPSHYFGSPVAGVSLSAFGAGNSPDGYITPTADCDETQLAAGSLSSTVYKYDEASPDAPTCAMAQWYALSSSDNTVAGQGYSVALTGAGLVSVSGQIDTAASYLVPCTNSNWSNATADKQGNKYNSGWNLISNPYLSTLNISDNGAAFDQEIQVWITEGAAEGSYRALIAGSGGPTAAMISAFQAFMVHETSPGSANYQFNMSDTVSTQRQFYRTAAAANQLTVTALNTTTGLTDETTVGFNADATVNFDSQMDANKLPGALTRHTLYTVEADSQWMSINNLPTLTGATEVPMGFEPGVSGAYTLSFNGTFDPGTSVTLVDKQTQSSQDISVGNYTFTANPTDNRDRFTLIFKPAAATGIAGVTDNNNIPIWSYQNKVSVDFTMLKNVDATITIYDLLGRELSSEKQEGNGIYTKTLDNIDAAFVIVKAVNGSETATKQVFITK